MTTTVLVFVPCGPLAGARPQDGGTSYQTWPRSSNISWRTGIRKIALARSAAPSASRLSHGSLCWDDML